MEVEPHTTELDIFIIMEFRLCDDYYYGYNEHLHSVFSSLEEAKTMFDKLLLIQEKWDEDDGNFIQIIRMKIGNTKKEIIFDSSKPEKKLL